MYWVGFVIRPFGKNRIPSKIDAINAKHNALIFYINLNYFLVDCIKSSETELAVTKRNSKIAGRNKTVREYLKRLLLSFISNLLIQNKIYYLYKQLS